MAREILFRGKRLDDGEWVEGWYLMYCFGRWPLVPCIIPSQLAIDGEIRHCRVDPATVGQYTGMEDMNGRKIFEGDVVDFDEKRFMVEMYRGRWTIATCDTRYGGLYAVADDCKVIGNIHDNPELIGGRADE